MRHTLFICLWVAYLAERGVGCWSNQMAVAASKATLNLRTSYNKMVFLVYLDDGPLRTQELANFMWSLQNCQDTQYLLHHLIVGCRSKEVQSECRKLHPHAEQCVTHEQSRSRHKWDPSINSWVRGTWRKLELASEFLEQGYDVGWSDTDVLIVSDPLSYVRQYPADIYVAPGEPNTGFMYFRMNNHTSNFVATWLSLRQTISEDFQIDDQSAFIMLYSMYKRPVLFAKVEVLPETQFKLGCGGCGLDLLAESEGRVWFDRSTMCPRHEWRSWVYWHLTCAGLGSNHAGLPSRKVVAQEGLIQVFTEQGVCSGTAGSH